MIFRKTRKIEGAALVEYGLLIAGVALVATAAVSIFGHKTSDLVASVATVLPGAHSDSNSPMLSGNLIETTPADAADPTGNPIEVDIATILTNTGTERLGNNLGVDVQDLIIESN